MSAIQESSFRTAIGSNYFVDSDGSVWSLRRRELRRLKPIVCADGYARVSLYAGHSRVFKAVHRIVAEALLKQQPGRDFVNHRNGVKTDNRLCNLEWVTRSENMRHAVKSGLHSMRHLRDEASSARAIAMRAGGATYAAIAQATGRSISTVHGYCSRARPETMPRAATSNQGVI